MATPATAAASEFRRLTDRVITAETGQPSR
jgi:hypothetical protein